MDRSKLATLYEKGGPVSPRAMTTTALRDLNRWIKTVVSYRFTKLCIISTFPFLDSIVNDLRRRKMDVTIKKIRDDEYVTVVHGWTPWFDNRDYKPFKMRCYMDADNSSLKFKHESCSDPGQCDVCYGVRLSEQSCWTWSW